VFVVAACGLVYELVAGAVSSYLLGDAVTQFSLVIGVFLCAMGFGSFLSRFVRGRLIEMFVEVEIWIGLAGGLSSLVMFAVSAYAMPVFVPVFFALCALLGTLVGLEIPLLVRILQDQGGVSSALSAVLALDYAGALAGAVAFPFLALPYLGLSRASVVFGVMNLAVAAAGIRLLPEGSRRGAAVRVVAASVVLVAAMAGSGRMVSFLEDALYQDSVVYSKDTQYQRIVITRWRDDVRLFLNGHLQFCSLDEARYHEALVLFAMEAATDRRNVLILGGGDGMAAREVLKYPRVESVTLVDIDPEMIRLGRNRPELVALNKGSMNSPRLRAVPVDAMKYLEVDRGFYDVIIADLPDPSTEALSKLYSQQFYTMALRRLAAGGVLVSQATSPFYAREAFWCIRNTLAAAAAGRPEGFSLFAYHLDVPSFGDWGFVLATARPIDPARMGISVPARYLSPSVMAAMFAFGADSAEVKTAVSTLDNPVVHRYHKHGWERFNR
jgi:spermidine synthase